MQRRHRPVSCGGTCGAISRAQFTPAAMLHPNGCNATYLFIVQIVHEVHKIEKKTIYKKQKLKLIATVRRYTQHNTLRSRKCTAIRTNEPSRIFMMINND